MRGFSSEFALTVECCRQAFAGGDARNIHELGAAVDWARFTRVVKFHRVQGLVWDGLRSSATEVPAEAAHALSSDAEAIVAANLGLAIEARDLASAFAQAGVPVLFVKGLTLAALAYPKPLLKMGWDVDVLIDPRQLDRAVELLGACDYRLGIPRPGADLRAWHRRRKESVWTRDHGLTVELHTRLADSRRLIPTIDVHSPRQLVEVANGIALPTLADDELFAYLCVHGASSAWFRLKWITDVAAMLHCKPGIERLYERSQELGAGRASGHALLLADRLYGTLAGSALKHRLLEDGGQRRLLSLAVNQLAGRAEPREPSEAPFGTWRIHATQLLLKPRVGFKAGELYRQVADAVLDRIYG